MISKPTSLADGDYPPLLSITTLEEARTERQREAQKNVRGYKRTTPMRQTAAPLEKASVRPSRARINIPKRIINERTDPLGKPEGTPYRRLTPLAAQRPAC